MIRGSFSSPFISLPVRFPLFPQKFLSLDSPNILLVRSALPSPLRDDGSPLLSCHFPRSDTGNIIYRVLEPKRFSSGTRSRFRAWPTNQSLLFLPKTATFLSPLPRKQTPRLVDQVSIITSSCQSPAHQVQRISFETDKHGSFEDALLSARKGFPPPGPLPPSP